MARWLSTRTSRRRELAALLFKGAVRELQLELSPSADDSVACMTRVRYAQLRRRRPDAS